MSTKTNFFSYAGTDIAAGLVVFLVALPLCLGIALASGAPLYSGIITGIVGGIVVGFLSKSQLSVSGPAAGLTAIVLAAITELGAFNIFLCAVVVAGVIQIALGYLRAGVIADYLPSNVIEGMLAAIGIIIILKQIPHAIGYDRDYEGDFSFQEFGGGNTFSTLIEALRFITMGTTVIALISLAILVLWERTPSLKRFIYFPAPLAVVVVSIILNEVFKSVAPNLIVQPEHLVSLPVASNVGEFVGQFMLPNFAGFARLDVWTVGATLAIVASVETLLSIEAIDRLDPHKRRTPTSHELKAQGAGNIISGFLGGLPLTSVIIRSSANVNSNAQSKLSTITHGFLLLLCVALIPFLVNLIPLAALAAILLVTGYKLAKPAAFKKMWRDGWYQFVPFVVTILAVVFTDLLIGVALGLAVSIFFLLLENSKVPYFFRRQGFNEGEIIHIHLAQQVTFLNKASIKTTFENLPGGSYVILDADETAYIDHDILEIIREFQETQAPERNIRLDTVGFDESYRIENTLAKQVADIGIAGDGTTISVFDPKRQHDELLGNLIEEKEGVKV